jgi:signal transduction histidine kinase
VTASEAAIPTRSPTRTSALDIVIALAAFAATLALLASGGNSSRGLDPLGVALAVLSTFPLVARRRSPLAVFVITTMASAAFQGLNYELGPPFGPTIALFFLAASEQARTRVALTLTAVAGLFAVHVGAAAVAHRGFPYTPLLLGIVVWGVAGFAGDRVRLRRERTAQLEERARYAERDAKRGRELAAAQERTRIARDLHDSAGHAINVILVQAGAARLLLLDDPDRARVAVETIEDVARDTLGEIDQLVRSLRDGDRADAVEPPLGLAALAGLARSHEANGLALTLRTSGAPRPLPPPVDRAAYRILQEALTNAARHGDATADVEVDYGDDALELVVENPIATRLTTDSGGLGLVGMHERAVLLGGELNAGEIDGRFRVRARLPYSGASA